MKNILRKTAIEQSDSISTADAQGLMNMARLRGRADAGDTAAMQELAELMIGAAVEFGRRGEPEHAAELLSGAVEWLTKATRLGSSQAFAVLARTLTTEDILAWVKRELPAGNPQARKFMDKIKGR